MKLSNLRLTVILMIMIGLVGCASNPALYRRLPGPIKKIVKAGPLSYVLIFKESQRKLNGSFPNNGLIINAMSVGESVVLFACGDDENGRRIKKIKKVTWKCDKGGKLSATEGQSVTFTLIAAEPSDMIYVTAIVGDEDGSVVIELK